VDFLLTSAHAALFPHLAVAMEEAENSKAILSVSQKPKWELRIKRSGGSKPKTKD
jgi:hypothetical protein